MTMPFYDIETWAEAERLLAALPRPETFERLGALAAAVSRAARQAQADSSVRARR
jgi:hypothetical protein